MEARVGPSVFVSSKNQIVIFGGNSAKLGANKGKNLFARQLTMDGNNCSIERLRIIETLQKEYPCVLVKEGVAIYADHKSGKVYKFDMATKIESLRVVDFGKLDYTTKKQKDNELKLDCARVLLILRLTGSLSSYTNTWQNDSYT